MLGRFSVAVFLIFCMANSYAQRLDFGAEFVLPGISPSIVSTKYDYISDDPVSYDFARIKHKTQIRPGFNMGTGVFAQFSYRMFSIKATVFPIYTINTSFGAYFPDAILGEDRYVGATDRFGCQNLLQLKYSFKTFRNKKIAILAGGFYFRNYGNTDESASLLHDSELSHYDAYKFLLWDDRKFAYGLAFGIEFNWLNKTKQSRRITVNYHHLNKVGYGGFNQGILAVQLGFANLNILSSLKRNKIYIIK